MKFLKDHGYGGVIIWSFDLDDKIGDVCNEGPFPLFNAAKRELLILPEHLVNANKKCQDDNSTWLLEHFGSHSISSIKTSFFLLTFYISLLCILQ